VCPHCRQNAPIVYRGLQAYCTACGKPRAPLAGNAVQLAGQPSKVGGVLARVTGWLVLAFGLSAALFLGTVLQMVFATTHLGYVVGLPIAVVSSVVAYFLLKGGKTLAASGASAERSARLDAVFGLARNRGGIVRPLDFAQSIGVPVETADALLTDLAKTSPDEVVLEVDDAGGIYYRFPRLGGDPLQMRIEEANAKIRVDGDPQARVRTHEDARREAEAEAEAQGAADPARRRS
jgi:hypothetical protein